MTDKRSYSNSEINTFDRCHLEYFYTNEVNLRRIGDDTGAHHQEFGKAVHKGLELLYGGSTLKDAQDALRAAYPTQLDPADKAKTAQNGCYTLQKYWEHYGGDTQWKLVATVEAREFREDGFGVKPDLVVQDEDSNVYLIDHKTTGAYLNTDYFTQYEPNSQITHYIHWCREKYGQCDGFIVNALAFRFRERAYKGQPAGFWCAFERQTFQRTKSQIQVTLDATNEAIADIGRCRTNDYWRPNEQPRTCKFCSYKSICSAGWNWKEDEQLILTSYRQVCNKAISQTDEHCNLDLGHKTPCSSDVIVMADQDIIVEV